jgi:hypothetical protein
MNADFGVLMPRLWYCIEGLVSAGMERLTTGTAEVALSLSPSAHGVKQTANSSVVFVADALGLMVVVANGSAVDGDMPKVRADASRSWSSS